MAIKGMASSSSSPFFPPNFLLQIQNPHNQQDHSRGLSMVHQYGLLEEEECLELGGEIKKRRLGIEQVRTLEKNFEMGNKLEPERKMQLAGALGLQPRQVAIWFQNRRARWKNKQLEKDYDVLKRQFDAIMSENQALHSHNKKLQTEISSLVKGRRETTSEELINLNKETEGSNCSNTSRSSDQNNSCSEEINLVPAAANIIESHDEQSNIPFFPCTNIIRPLPKIHEENFSNLLCNMDIIDQSAFWSWADPHTSNFHATN